MLEPAAQSTVDRGRRAEDIAACWLRLRGMDVLDRNRRAADGEIDLIVRDGLTLVFVEVRARASGSRVGAAESIRADKWNRMRRCARELAQEPHLRWAGRRMRLDAVVLETGADGFRLRHLQNLTGPAANR